MKPEELEQKHQELKEKHELEKEKVSVLKSEVKSIRKEAKEKAINYMAAGFSLVAGLAWNEAIKALIEYVFPLSKNTIFAKFLYAIVLTIIIVAITIYLRKIFDVEPKAKKEKENSDK